MRPDDALRAACRHCVTASAMLAAARLLARTPDATDADVAKTLAGSAVAGWADHGTSGRADPHGVSVVDRGGADRHHVRWNDVAAALRPGLTPARVARLSRVYGRYVDETLRSTDDGRSRLAARLASTELAQQRAEILAAAFEATEAQQSLFQLPRDTPRTRQR